MQETILKEESLEYRLGKNIEKLFGVRLDEKINNEEVIDFMKKLNEIREKIREEGYLVLLIARSQYIPTVYLAPLFVLSLVLGEYLKIKFADAPVSVTERNIIDRSSLLDWKLIIGHNKIIFGGESIINKEDIENLGKLPENVRINGKEPLEAILGRPLNRNIESLRDLEDEIIKEFGIERVNMRDQFKELPNFIYHLLDGKYNLNIKVYIENNGKIEIKEVYIKDLKNINGVLRTEPFAYYWLILAPTTSGFLLENFDGDYSFFGKLRVQNEDDIWKDEGMGLKYIEYPASIPNRIANVITKIFEINNKNSDIPESIILSVEALKYISKKVKKDLKNLNKNIYDIPLIKTLYMVGYHILKYSISIGIIYNLGKIDEDKANNLLELIYNSLDDIKVLSNKEIYNEIISNIKRYLNINTEVETKIRKIINYSYQQLRDLYRKSYSI